MFADVNMLLFPAPVSEGAEEAGWWDQGCEWGLRVGFVRSLFWSFLIPPFLWIELTPYMCRVLFGSWLALRMPLQCPFSNFRSNMSSIQNRKRARTIDIYTISFKMHCSWVLCFQTIICIYIYMYWYLMCLVRGLRLECAKTGMYVFAFLF